MKKLILLLIVGVFLISMVSASTKLSNNSVMVNGSAYFHAYSLPYLIDENLSSSVAEDGEIGAWLNFSFDGIYNISSIDMIRFTSGGSGYGHKVNVSYWNIATSTWINFSTVQLEQDNPLNYTVYPYEVGWYETTGIRISKEPTWSISSLMEVWFNVTTGYSISANLITPINNNSIIETATINASATPTGTGIQNVTLFIWNNAGSLVNNTVNNVSGNEINYTNWVVPSLDIGRYYWNVYACSNNSITICSFAPTNYTFFYGISNQTLQYPSNTFETEYVNFNTTFNVTSGTPTAKLWYNGTAYAGTGTNTLGNEWRFTANVYVPSGNLANKNHFWEVISSGISHNTSVQTQTVTSTNFTLCGSAPYNIPFLNFTFKNETTGQEYVTSIISSSWTYWLSSASNNKTYSYTNLTENPSYAFCGVNASKTIYVDLSSMTYDNAESDQRSYIDSFTLTNSTNNTILFLLPSSDSTSTTFLVLDQAGSPISGVVVDVVRSGYGLVESKETDDAGTATFFLNPLISYTITATKASYETYSATITPTQSSYTITLGTTSVSSIVSYSRGINYTIYPIETQLNQSVVYGFNFTINSNYYTLTRYGINITDYYGIQVGYAEGTSGGGGIVNVNLDTGTNKTFRTSVFYEIDGNVTTISPKTYYIINGSATGYSVWNFFNRLKSYTDSDNDSDGLFGLVRTNGYSFSFSLIMIILIMGTVGIVSYKFGISSIWISLAIMFVVVYIFEYLVGLIDFSPSNNVPIASILIGLATMGALWWEIRL